MKIKTILNHRVWDAKAWLVLERLIGLIGLLVLIYGVYTSLLKIEAKQALHEQKLNSIQLMIKSQMKDPENWTTADQLMNP